MDEHTTRFFFKFNTFPSTSSASTSRLGSSPPRQFPLCCESCVAASSHWSSIYVLAGPRLFPRSGVEPVIHIHALNALEAIVAFPILTDIKFRNIMPSSILGVKTLWNMELNKEPDLCALLVSQALNHRTFLAAEAAQSPFRWASDLILYKACPTRGFHEAKSFIYSHTHQHFASSSPLFRHIMIGVNSLTTDKKSERFSAADADVTFRSSNGILFAIHRKNVEANAGGFPPSECETNGEIVQLTEDASTLELLFQFMYPQRPPDLDVVEFAVLMALAEAAEKYEVYGLMYICKNRFRNILPAYNMEIIAYAAKHDYPDLIGVMAPLMLEAPLAEMLVILPPQLFAAWVLYRERWENVRRTAATDSSVCRCSACITGVGHILFRLGSVNSLRNLAVTFENESSRHSSSKWRQSTEEGVKAIPEYTKFLDFVKIS